VKRLGTLSVLIIVTVTMLACGGGSTPPPAAGTASTGAAASSDDDGPNVQNVIWMTKNDGHPDTSITAACVGTVTAYRVKTKKKHKVRWYVQNDPYNNCPNFEEDEVEVRFNEPTMAENTDPMATPLSNIKAVNGRIQARVHASNDVVPETRVIRKYLIFYKNEKASPDPELDIDGSCSGCGSP